MRVKSRVALLLSIGVLVAALVAAGFAPESLTAAWSKARPALQADDLEVGYYVTILDEDGQTVTKTGRAVYPGDEVILGTGSHYRVTSVDDDVAQAELLGVDQDLVAYRGLFASMELPAFTGSDQQPGRVAVYHSHGTECYVPTEGEAFRDPGGILEVGAAFADGLRHNHVQVHHDRTSHSPHDAQAYARSRQTAMQLLKESPTAIFDIHRDGVPDPDFYRVEAPEEGTTQLRIVVGRQNPGQEANLDFARRLMSFANEQHPGLVKEIFMANGNYNQDLMPTALLVEAGTYTQTRPEAEGGIELLADAVPVVLGIGAGAPGADQVRPEAGATGWNTMFVILAVTILGAAAFLVVAAGGFPQAADKLREFFSKEFGLFRDKVRLRDDDERK